MSATVAADHAAERAILGAVVMLSDPRWVSGLTTQGLRPKHFWWDNHAALFTAALSLADHQRPADPITLFAEMERLGLTGFDRAGIDNLAGEVPASGHYQEYVNRVIELARWRERQTALHRMGDAVQRRDTDGWARAYADLDSATAGTRTESYSPAQWASLAFDYFSATAEEASEYAISLPFTRLTDALGGGLSPGEVMALSGPTSHGKSAFADMCLDHAANRGKSCHLYMTEMTAINRALRYLARNTGVPFMRQRRRALTDADRKLILAELPKLNYGCTVAADWDVDDIVRDALRARYDFVVVDLLHGFHYEDERGLDRLSKAMQRLARTSTTLDGHPGTAVMAVTHLKEEGTVKGKIPRPGISSIKGGSSIKQDADFVAFVWQDQDESGAPNGEGEIWLAKGRSSGLDRVEVRVNAARFRFELRAEELAPASEKAAF
jgi:replicative DNA helicase